MEKMTGYGLDVNQVNIEKLKELFPQIVSDGKIDFDMLRTILGDNVDDSIEKYQFTWNGKSETIRGANLPTAATLIPCKDKSVNWDTTENLYIEGDNLEVLKTLQKTYFGKIKMIYIDPPYNTGHEFVYKDNFKNSLENYKEQTCQVARANPETSGRYHTDWLNMMYCRLMLAFSLLDKDGMIFISIDDNEQSNLRKICDEIFGEKNFVADFVWNSRKSVSNDAVVSLNHNYTLAYSKDYSVFYENKANFKLADLGEDFDNPDNDVRGKWKADPFDSPGIRPNLTYPIVNPNTGETFMPPVGRCWRTGELEYKKLLEENRIVFGKNGTSKPQLKRFYSEAKEKGLTPKSLWDDCGTATDGTKELIDIFDGKIFETPKPVSLIHRILELAGKNDALVMDFFSGSATTAHAVMQLNAEDGGKRKFIMVQIPEKCEEKSSAYQAGYGTICDIGQERIRRAGKKIYNELVEKKEKAGLLADEYVNPDTFDYGFKVFKLESTNINPWDSSVELDEDLLSMLKETIKDGRSGLDVAYEIMLKYGVFDKPIKEVEIAGKKMFDVGEGFMIICLADGVNVETYTAIAQLQPKCVVFKEDGFADDNAKMNATYTLKRLGAEKVLCI